MNIKEADVKFTIIERFTLLLMGLIAFFLGVHGYYEFFKSIKQPATAFDYAYNSINLFLMQFTAKGTLPWTLELSRWLAPATLSYAVVRAFLILANKRAKLFRLKRKKGHGLIFGLTKDTFQLACSMQDEGIYPVLVDENEQNEYLGALITRNILCVIANPADTTLLNSLNLAQAHYLLANTGSDTTNLEIIHQALEIEKRTRLNAVCKIENKSLSKALYNRPLFATNHQNMTTKIVNYSKISARWLVREYGPDTLIKEIKELKVINICLICNNVLIEAVIMRFAEIGIYSVNAKLSLTLVSSKSSDNYTNLRQNTALSKLVELDVLHINELDSDEMGSLLSNTHFDCMYMCLTATDEALLATQFLLDKSVTCPIVITETDNLHTFKWLENEFESYELIHFAHNQAAVQTFTEVFGSAQDQLAKAIHNQYLKEQKKAGIEPAQNSSMVEWDDLPEVLKDANRNQADHIPIKCQYLTSQREPSAQAVKAALNSKTVEELAIMEHNRWVAEKVLTGWQFTNGEKNPEKRLSPSLRPWTELNEEDKQKDRDAILNLPKLVELTTKLG